MIPRVNNNSVSKISSIELIYSDSMALNEKAEIYPIISFRISVQKVSAMPIKLANQAKLLHINKATLSPTKI